MSEPTQPVLNKRGLISYLRTGANVTIYKTDVESGGIFIQLPKGNFGIYVGTDDELRDLKVAIDIWLRENY